MLSNNLGRALSDRRGLYPTIIIVVSSNTLTRPAMVSQYERVVTKNLKLLSTLSSGVWDNYSYLPLDCSEASTPSYYFLSWPSPKAGNLVTCMLVNALHVIMFGCYIWINLVVCGLVNLTARICQSFRCIRQFCDWKSFHLMPNAICCWLFGSAEAKSYWCQIHLWTFGLQTRQTKLDHLIPVSIQTYWLEIVRFDVQRVSMPGFHWVYTLLP